MFFLSDSDSRSSMMYNSSDENSVSGNVIVNHDMDDMDLEDDGLGSEGKTPQYPLDECFGSIILSSKKVSQKT